MSTNVSEVRAASIIIALMMEAARTSETSVDIQLRTWQCIPALTFATKLNIAWRTKGIVSVKKS
jgi:hypothetical protein